MSERIVAIVPIRSLRNGKTRLTPILEPEEREVFLRHAAKRVVDAAVDSGAIETVLVVSPDAETLVWAADLGPTVIAAPQPRHSPGLNGAVEAGRAWALDQGASAVVSLFADLPLIVPDDIRRLTARPEPVVLGPDRRGEGTNALLLRLRGRGPEFTFAFGEGSLTKHLDEARRLGLDLALHDAPGIGFDLDTPEDWADFLDAVADRSEGEEAIWDPGSLVASPALALTPLPASPVEPGEWGTAADRKCFQQSSAGVRRTPVECGAGVG